ncbi:MAG: TAXI family TRAP transporter solute-binding subunit [Rhodobacteraceae bacterium]|nr:TAXI family TRAP transporter solute-binding subunit [Paracoccaceae bacterium]
MNRATRLGLAAVMCGVLSTAAAAQAPLAIGTNPQGSVAYAAGSAIADVVGDALDISFTVVPLGGPTAVLPALLDGEFNFGFANAQAAAAAYMGRGAFDGRPQEGLRVATVIFPLYFGMLTSRQTGITTLAEMRGRRAASEFSSQRNTVANMVTGLEMAGLTYDDVTAVPVQSGADSVQMLIDGQLDVTNFSVGSGVIAQLDAAVGARFLSLTDDDAGRALVARRMPGASIETIPAGYAPGIVEDTNLFSAPFIILTSADEDDDTVYNVVKAMAEHQQALAEAQGQFAAITPALMAQPGLPIPYHPGAIRYFQEAGTWH